MQTLCDQSCVNLAIRTWKNLLPMLAYKIPFGEILRCDVVLLPSFFVLIMMCTFIGLLVVFDAGCCFNDFA